MNGRMRHQEKLRYSNRDGWRNVYEPNRNWTKTNMNRLVKFPDFSWLLRRYIRKARHLMRSALNIVKIGKQEHQIATRARCLNARTLSWNTGLDDCLVSGIWYHVRLCMYSNPTNILWCLLHVCIQHVQFDTGSTTNFYTSVSDLFTALTPRSASKGHFHISCSTWVRGWCPLMFGIIWGFICRTVEPHDQNGRVGFWRFRSLLNSRTARLRWGFLSLCTCEC